ncbi:DUF6542 domain-containing protein [Streptomyces sp. NPDC052396]|uniref:DUF6542 domain-containing protein n=1 Tax=Streptomyces sp. NPDC052396 TaxID=3365689 RepID=UPI0037D5439D
MERPSTRSTQHRPRRPSPVPRPTVPVGQGAAGTVYRVRTGRTPPPLPRVLRRLSAARLTGLGGGLLTTGAMLVTGALDSALLNSSPAAYGMCFLLACTTCALMVRPAEWMAAPVGVPIAFAVGAVPVGDGAGGLTGQLMGLVGFLSLQAGWLYGGTLLATLVALVRRMSWIRQRKLARIAQRKRPSRPPRSPRCSPAAQARPRR